MFAKAVIVWVAGLLTLVPYGTYYLLFHAPRDQYALLIASLLFWVLGYWSVVGPLLAAIKVRSVFRAIEQAGSRDDMIQALSSAEARDAAIDLIASENRIPRFLAARVYRLLVRRMASRWRDIGRSLDRTPVR
jgi:hypothetical protein